MEKLVYLLGSDQAGDALRERLLGELSPRLLELGALALTVDVADGDADVPTPMPWPADEPTISACVSFWLDCHDRRGPLEEALGGAAQRLAGYLVSEALYRDYGGNAHAAPRDWPDGRRSPGVLMLTLLERPARLSREAWLAHWHGVQSPVSEAIQPRTRYVRNEVIRAVTAGAPPWEGIVEECWPSAEHLTDPMLFYLAGGSRERLREHMGRMLDSVRAFLDLERIRSVTMSEYLMRSFPASR